MNRKSKRIGTFKEFLIEQKHQQKVNEDVKIEVDWWDQCIVEVLQMLEDECGGLLSQSTLGTYIKNKYAILGREWDEYCDNIYKLHIKDLIWQLHGDGFCVDCNSGDNAVIHAKGVAIEELAKAIWQRVIEKTDSPLVANNIPTTRLVDKEPEKMVAVTPVQVCSDEDYPDENCVDLPFEGKKFKRVKKYKEYLKEALATKLKSEDSNACIDYCLNRIEREAGSLDPYAIFDAAVKYADARAKGRMVAMYIRPMVSDFLDNSNIIICNLDETDDEEKQDLLIGDALDTLMDNVTDDVLLALYKVNGGKDVEVE